jgi:hypothetical protein
MLDKLNQLEQIQKYLSWLPGTKGQYDAAIEQCVAIISEDKTKAEELMQSAPTEALGILLSRLQPVSTLATHLGDVSSTYEHLKASFHIVVAEKYTGCRKFIDGLNTTHEAHGSVLVESLKYLRAATACTSEHLIDDYQHSGEEAEPVQYSKLSGDCESRLEGLCPDLIKQIDDSLHNHEYRALGKYMRTLGCIGELQESPNTTQTCNHKKDAIGEAVTEVLKEAKHPLEREFERVKRLPELVRDEDDAIQSFTEEHYTFAKDRLDWLQLATAHLDCVIPDDTLSFLREERDRVTLCLSEHAAELERQGTDRIQDRPKAVRHSVAHLDYVARYLQTHFPREHMTAEKHLRRLWTTLEAQLDTVRETCIERTNPSATQTKELVIAVSQDLSLLKDYTTELSSMQVHTALTSVEPLVQDCVADTPQGVSAPSAELVKIAQAETAKGKADQAMEPGTHIFVDSIGHGIYESWSKSMLGANSHTIAFGGRPQTIHLKKYRWNVVLNEPEPEPAPEPEPSEPDTGVTSATKVLAESIASTVATVISQLQQICDQMKQKWPPLLKQDNGGSPFQDLREIFDVSNVVNPPRQVHGNFS